MHYRVFIKAILYLLIALSLGLTTGCTNTGCTNNDEVSGNPEENRWPFQPQPERVDAVFGLAKTFSDGSGGISSLKNEFDKLNDADLGRLAKKTEGDYNFILYLSLGSASPEVADVVERFLDKIDANTADVQLKKELNGKDAFRIWRDAKRPSGEQVDDLNLVIAKVLPHAPARINDLKDSSNSFDNEAFNKVISRVGKAKAKVIIDKLDSGNFTTWLTWAMGNKAAGKPAFLLLYDKFDASRQADMRNRLLGNLYGTAALSEIIDPTDTWGLRAGIETDTYKLAKNPAAANAHEGSLLYVLTKRAIDDAAVAGNNNAFIALRPFATAIKAVFNNDGNYTNHATVETFGGPGEIAKTVLDTALTGTHVGYSYYYLDLPLPQKGVLAAAGAATVSTVKLKALYDNLVGIDSQKIADLAAEGGVSGFSFLNFVLQREASAETLDMLTKYVTGLGSVNAAAHFASFGSRRLITSIFGDRLVLLGGGADAPAELKKLKLAVVDILPGSSLKHLKKPQTEDIVDIVYPMFATVDAPAAKQTFKKIYAKVSALHKEHMRSKLLNLAYKPANAATILALLAAIDSVNDDLGLNAGFAADEYKLAKRAGGAPFAGNLLYVLTKRAIEDSAAAVGNAYTNLRSYAMAIRAAINNDANYTTLAIITASGGEVTKGQLDNALAPTRVGYSYYYLDLPLLEKGVFAAASTATVSAADLQTLYNLVITGPQEAADLAAEGAGPGKDTFLHLIVKRAASLQTAAMMTDYLTKLGANAPAAFKKVGTTGRPLETLVGPRAGALGDNPAQLEAMIKGALNTADGAEIDHLNRAQIEARVAALYAPVFSVNNKAEFKKIYGKVNGTNKELMHSKLLNLAYSDSIGAVRQLLGEMLHANDPLGLRGVAAGGDNFKLAKRVGGGATFHGILLYVLTERAIEDATFAGTLAAYTTLRSYATIFKTALPGGYIPYATTDVSPLGVQGGNTPFSRLEAVLSGNMPGYSYFCLLLGQNYAPLNENVLMAAADAPAINSYVLKWLFDEVITNAVAPTGPHAIALGAPAMVGTVIADSFINRLTNKAAKRADADILYVLNEFLIHLMNHGINSGYTDFAGNVIAAGNPAGEAAVLDQVKTAGATSGTNPLQKLVDNKRVDKGSNLNEMIALLAASDDGTAIRSIASDADANNLMSAVHEKGDQATMTSVFSHLAPARYDAMVAFAMTHRTESIPLGANDEAVLAAMRDSNKITTAVLLAETTKPAPNWKKVLFYIQVIAKNQAGAQTVAAVNDAGILLHNLIVAKRQKAESVSALKFYLSKLPHGVGGGPGSWEAVSIDATGGQTAVQLINGLAHPDQAALVGDPAHPIKDALLIFKDAGGILKAAPPTADGVADQAP